MDPREELTRHYRWLRRYGCNDSHSGNASIRDDDGFWVTPTGACADTLQPEALVRCDLSQVGQGASLDARLHQAVYRASPESGAVLHSHGPYSVAMTMDGLDFIPADFEGNLYFPKVPVITVSFDRYVDQAPALVAAVLGEYRIAVVRGHGVYAHAPTMNLAYKWTCSLELSAKTAFIARQAGTLRP